MAKQDSSLHVEVEKNEGPMGFFELEERERLLLRSGLDFQLMVDHGKQFLAQKNESDARKYFASGIRLRPISMHLSIRDFSRAIAYAPQGSKVLAMAFANRSAVLMAARLYKDAISDIDRALGAGYPEELKPKLLTRKSWCYWGLDCKAFEEGSDGAPPQAPFDIERMDMSDMKFTKMFNMAQKLGNVKALKEERQMWQGEEQKPLLPDINTQIIGASCAIKIEYSEEQKQQTVVATRDIKAGEFVFVGEPYAAVLDRERRYTNCWHCFGQTHCSVSCSHCPNVTYCSSECKVTSWEEYHKYECKILLVALRQTENSVRCMKIETSSSSVLALRIFFKALKNAGDFLNLKTTVKRLDLSNGFNPRLKGFTGNFYDSNSYESLQAIEIMNGALMTEFIDQMKFHVHQLITILATETELFGKKISVEEITSHEDITFATALLWKYTYISVFNVFRSNDLSDELEPVLRDLSISPMYNMFTKGCWANVAGVSFGKTIGFCAINSIKEGEQLVVCPGFQYHEVVPKRRRLLSIDRIGKPCTCLACIKLWPIFDKVKSYTEIGLKAIIRRDLLKSIIRQKRSSDKIKQWDLESYQEAVNGISDTLALFRKHVGQPCKEVIKLSKNLHIVLCRLGNHFSEWLNEDENRNETDHLPYLVLDREIPE